MSDSPRSQLIRSLQLPLPDSTVSLTGAHPLNFADSKASDSLFGLALPLHLKSSALLRLNLGDHLTFLRTELAPESAATILNDYITAIADVLNDRKCFGCFGFGREYCAVFLEYEDDCAMLAENYSLIWNFGCSCGS